MKNSIRIAICNFMEIEKGIDRKKIKKILILGTTALVITIGTIFFLDLTFGINTIEVLVSAFSSGKVVEAVEWSVPTEKAIEAVDWNLNLDEI